MIRPRTRINNWLAAAFRAAGGKVLCYYYGEWQSEPYVSYNLTPWKWLNDFQDRLPTTSVAVPAKLQYTFSAYMSHGFTAGNATITANDGYITVTSNASADPIMYTPAGLALTGAEITAITIKLRKVSGTAWDGKMFFLTTADQAWNTAKKIDITQPTWDGTVQTVVIPMTGNSIWTGGTIDRLRFDFGADAASVYEVHDISFTTTGATAASENITRGLPSDQQWAVDWEINQAYASGIDVFVHNFYWGTIKTGLQGNSITKNSIDLHFASAVQPAMKACLQWSNHNASSPFASVAELYGMLNAWNAYFASQRYWKIGGKPVVFIFSPENLKTWASALFGISNNREALKRAVDEINAYLSGLPDSNAKSGVFFASQGDHDHPWWAGNAAGWTGALEYSGFGAMTRYNLFSYNGSHTQTSSGGSVADQRYVAAPVATYNDLLDVQANYPKWTVNDSGNKVPVWPVAMAGWDGRAWQAKNGAGFDTKWNCFASPGHFKSALEAALVNSMASASKQPSATPPAVTIYAWNEYGEGGFICPSVRYGNAMCRAVKDTFGGPANG